MIPFYILLHNFNTNKPEQYDIMPYLMDTYKECKKKKAWWYKEKATEPETEVDFKDFVDSSCRHRFWARCEYEWLMIGWPPGKTDTLECCQQIINKSTKIDAYEQIKMNFDVIVTLFINNISYLGVQDGKHW